MRRRRRFVTAGRRSGLVLRSSSPIIFSVNSDAVVPTKVRRRSRGANRDSSSVFLRQWRRRFVVTGKGTAIGCNNSKGVDVGSTQNPDLNYLPMPLNDSDCNCKLLILTFFRIVFTAAPWEGKLNDALFGLVDLRLLPEFIERQLRYVPFASVRHNPLLRWVETPAASDEE
ncbi:hypothetical protein Lal_00013181 [Lupinus albus]|nr:hypothetical protein Lal_00013181 [Lupinus albus]